MQFSSTGVELGTPTVNHPFGYATVTGVFATVSGADFSTVLGQLSRQFASAEQFFLEEVATYSLVQSL